jgi:hypothetical protein
VVRDSRGPVAEPTADCDDAHLELVQVGAVAHLLEGAQRCKGGDGIAVGPEPLEGKTGRHPEHVRLGDTHVDEALRMRVRKLLDDHEAEVTGEQHQTSVGLRQLRQLVNDGFSHAAAASSRSAR